MRNAIIFSVTSVSVRQGILNGFNNLEACFKVVKAHHPADQVAAAPELVWGKNRGAGALEAKRWRAEGCGEEGVR